MVLLAALVPEFRLDALLMCRRVYLVVLLHFHFTLLSLYVTSLYLTLLYFTLLSTLPAYFTLRLALLPLYFAFHFLKEQGFLKGQLRFLGDS